MQRIIRIKEVRTRLGGVSKSTFYNWTTPASKYFKAEFPKKIRVGHIVGYLEHEIDAFIRQVADASKI
ncbi:helix-turn-helix transcriptional regulator [Fluviibacter phosphoraccumulans]|uniref:helix-turn-helix transcriptional regulator n=1 Tax=Fluviibacter phosphoraccumulans TaxID=1751046 RepID=UPI0024E1DA61|nr:AlpA family phage regulatory protein [Fluviibacter phosphoraccumulans]